MTNFRKEVQYYAIHEYSTADLTSRTKQKQAELISEADIGVSLITFNAPGVHSHGN